MHEEASQSVSAKPKLRCPACGALLQFSLKAHGITILPTDAEGNELVNGNAPPKLGRPPEDQKLLDAAQRAGLLVPFVKTVEAVKIADRPGDMEAFFLIFLRTLSRRLIPAYAMHELNRLFAHRPLEYYSGQGIGVVVVDGYMRLFVPNSQVVGQKVGKLGKQAGGVRRDVKIDDGAEKLQAWIRTRWGYVAGEGAMLDTMRKRSFGEFGLPVL